MSVGALKTEADLERWLYQRLDGMPVNRIGGLGDALAMLVPPGAAIVWLGSGVPKGYLQADGSAVSRESRAALFAAYGTTYGEGDGSTTFNLPDESEHLPSLPEGVWVVKI